MLTSYEYDDLSESQQFLLYATANLSAAIDVCERMQRDRSEYNWANGAVAHMLAAHSVELFLKGMLLIRQPEDLPKTHDIDCLIEKFECLYFEDEFKVDFPFRTVVLGDQDLAGLNRRNCRTPPSILFRYPIRDIRCRWDELCGVDPQSFSSYLETWRSECDRMVRRAAAAC